jgi:hypothetical protein
MGSCILQLKNISGKLLEAVEVDIHTDCGDDSIPASQTVNVPISPWFKTLSTALVPGFLALLDCNEVIGAIHECFTRHNQEHEKHRMVMKKQLQDVLPGYRDKRQATLMDGLLPPRPALIPTPPFLPLLHWDNDTILSGPRRSREREEEDWTKVVATVKGEEDIKVKLEDLEDGEAL